MGYSWKRARLSLKCKRSEQEFKKKQEEINTFMALHKAGYIDLYFADEAHFSLLPNVPYAWQEKGVPLLLPAQKSNERLTVFGLLSPDCNLYPHITNESLKANELVYFLDDFTKVIRKKQLSFLIMLLYTIVLF